MTLLYVELEDGPVGLAEQVAYLAEKLPGYIVRRHGAAVAVSNAEANVNMSEVVGLLLSAGVPALVYEPSVDQVAANNL